VDSDVVDSAVVDSDVVDSAVVDSAVVDSDVVDSAIVDLLTFIVLVKGTIRDETDLRTQLFYTILLFSSLATFLLSVSIKILVLVPLMPAFFVLFVCISSQLL
jgi:hypothetical protein